MNGAESRMRVFLDTNVLFSAEPDLLVTGDKDFHTKEIQEFFTVCTPGEFLQWFCQYG
jgi:predicted nucleic acid-binding protein